MSRIISALLAVTACLTVISCKQSVVPDPGVPLSLAEQRKELLSGITYQLHFTVPGQQDQPVMATETVTFTTKDLSQDVVLDFKAKAGSVHKLLVNGKAQTVRHEQEHLIIDAGTLIAGENSVTIDFEAGSAALNRNRDYMYALFVPDRARTAFPCFDQPDLKAIYTLSLTIPESWKAMTNGPVKDSVKTDSLKTWNFLPSDTISTYLFSFTAGAYQVENAEIDGRKYEFFYRETDSSKLALSIPQIFKIHAQSLQFMESYSGIPYPFKKFSFAAIPDFQFGGMEHPGAIWYNSGSLFLDSSATRNQLIRRANLIAHETSHMWFGDLVTMRWFNDVWMKEVFANFMADKILTQIMPDDNADLKFVTDHYPPAYNVDRTKGANPIRQPLDNLQEAGSLYGGIIYHKAPIMMLQLERLVGADVLRTGLQEYLREFAFDNATWPDLIAILDAHTKDDLQAWNDNWVNKPGRPVFGHPITDVKANTYGLFTVDSTTLRSIAAVNDPVLRMFNYLNLYENMLEGKYVTPAEYLLLVNRNLIGEKEELTQQMLLDQLTTVYWCFLPSAKRDSVSQELERNLWSGMTNAVKPNMKKMFFKAYLSVALTKSAQETLYEIWKTKAAPGGLKLSEDDYTDIAAALAVRSYPGAGNIVKEQLGLIPNPDRKLRLAFLLPALSENEKERDVFFESLKDKANRKKEAWVNDALRYLHHPLRQKSSEKYLLPSLELLEEIQRTGDIFFPQNWLQATLGTYQSKSAAGIVNAFIAGHPGFNSRLKNKLLQSADNLFRAQQLVK